MFRTFIIAIMALALFSNSFPALGQRLDGTLRGTVHDPTGVVVSGAEPTAINQSTGVRQSTQTTSTGEYVFPNLLVGTYTVEVRAKGFSDYLRKDVQVLPNQVVTADARVAVAAQGTVVEVTDAERYLHLAGSV